MSDILDQLKRYFPTADEIVVRFRQEDGSLSREYTKYRIHPAAPMIDENKAVIEIRRAEMKALREGRI